MKALHFTSSRKSTLAFIICLMNASGIGLASAEETNTQEKGWDIGWMKSFFGSSEADQGIVKLGSGSYMTLLPPGQKGPSDQNNQPALPSVTPGFKKPPQTNHWWSSLIWKYEYQNNWSDNLFAHPLSFRAFADGLEVGYPDKVSMTPFKKAANKHHCIQEYHYKHAPDLRLGIKGLSVKQTYVSDYSDWTVTADWADDTSQMQATLGKGIPYVYITKKGGDVRIACAAQPAIWHDLNGVLGITVNEHHYGIFGPTGSAWKKKTTTLSSTLNGREFYSVAILPDCKVETLELFRKHAYAFVTNTKVEWCFDEAKARVDTTFKIQTALKELGTDNSNVNTPLMALYKHQWQNTDVPLLDSTYISPRGVLKLFEGNCFTTRVPFAGILPFLPDAAASGDNAYDDKALYGYVDDVFRISPEERWGAWTDTHSCGKALGKIAQLVPIAEQVQHSEAKDLFIKELKSRLESWLQVSEERQFYYDSTWKTLIGFPASYGSNTHLNSHHFHYGYFIMAAATVAHFDPEWAQKKKWGGMVELLIKDAANWDRKDKQFPFLRHFDVYEGHSWASGIAAFASGNHEQSSSEEINFSTAVFLWGKITKNQDIANLGAYLHATATSAIPDYWFDVDHQIFPPNFTPVTLGILWGNGGLYSTWWEGFAPEVHGINFLPVQPGMLFLGRFPDYLKTNQVFMLSNTGNEGVDTWRDIHLEIKALYDSESAVVEFRSKAVYIPEIGETKAHAYHWIHHINALGQFNPAVKANVPTFGVFDKKGTRTYVGYNPEESAQVFKFSDGFELFVPARSMTSSAHAIQK